MKRKDDNKLRLDCSTSDPLLYRGLEKVAQFIRNSNGRGYLIGIFFELDDYEPIETTDLQSGVYAVKRLLEKVGFESSV